MTSTQSAESAIEAKREVEASPGVASRVLLPVFWALIAVYVLLVAYNIFSMDGTFSPDSIFYIDAAQNLLAGRGIATSMGELQPLVDSQVSLPRPMTVWAPLYPMMIAVLGLAGLHVTAGAFLLPVTFMFFCLRAAYLLLSRLYSVPVACFAVALLVHFFPLRHVVVHPWSESIGMTLVLASFFVLAGRGSDQSISNLRAFGGGVVAGLAVGVRYALIPVVGIAPLFFLSARPGRADAFRSLSFLAGTACVIAPVFGRSIWQTGSIGGARGASIPLDVGESFGYLHRALVASTSVESLLAKMFLAGVLVAIVILVVLQIRRGTFFENAREALVERRQFLLLVWAAGYLVFLMYTQTRVRVDPIDLRLVFPATLVFCMFIGAFLVQLGGFSKRVLAACAVALVLFGIGRELPDVRARMRAKLTPVYDVQAKLGRSETLTWLAQNVTTNDLLFAENGLDLPLYLGPVDTVFFRPSVIADSRISYADMTAYIEGSDACTRYRHIYIVLENKGEATETIADRYGQFTADLLAGSLTDYPGVVLRERLEDGSVFEYQCDKVVSVQ
ncbi:MAG: hypothetical protein IID08_04110 [Candidatus Hydrogenedentes bacterium]|nr:hypothetical protein [Candidatus Hydrogenedentota bacterium]